MRFISFAAAISLLIGAQAAAQDLESDKGKLSYSMGYRLGLDVQNRDKEFDLETLIQGLRDGAQGNDPQLAQEEMAEQLKAMQERLRAERMEQLKKLAAENKKKSEEFLAKNKGKKGIVEVPDTGIQYRVIEEGDGKRPSPDDIVTLHVRSSLPLKDGREIQSTYANGQPMQVKIDQARIPAWQKVLPLMKVGAKWQIFVPPRQGFGTQGNPPAVGPNEALAFDLELVRINENAAQAGGGQG